MDCTISSIHYCPVKSLSFQTIKSCNIKKDLGMLNDRLFAFSRGVDLEKAKLIEQNPNERKLNDLNFTKINLDGIQYNMITREWYKGNDCSVNYILVAKKN